MAPRGPSPLFVAVIISLCLLALGAEGGVMLTQGTCRAHDDSQLISAVDAAEARAMVGDDMYECGSHGCDR